MVATNQPTLDGATGPGISHEEALKVIAALAPQLIGDGEIKETYGGYGCNMAIRMGTIEKLALAFDERLPLYGWLEDIDFTRRLSSTGRIVEASVLRGVHLATKRGKTSGFRLGYSQVANPIYLVRKGSVLRSYAYPQLLRNVAKNLARSFIPEPWIDRRGRLKGNMTALKDLFLNRLDPARITTF